ncbi:tetraacyldisaccharide 4'-kinase [Alkanindiges illinoisensis]|uniref:tetraacyldisaccharide 4'-kinase n=1 Tax=Alkanindiges illinoisensis TaxID=197183 RepID=UPI00047E6C50|nr:tetraacyldisaccharide 4'-kinase [Alkanindiges illinoisensis]
MQLDQRFTQAWATQSAWLNFLRPLSSLYGLAISCRRYLYEQKILKSYRAPVPVMVIGNITVGGSGKTPLIIELVNFLHYFGLNVAVISRGYGGQGPFPRIVEDDDTPDIVGDEPVLIVQQTDVMMAVGPNRQQAIELILQHTIPDLILSDDGLQHLALQRDLEWIVLDVDRGLGNQQLLPAGFLREPASRLQTATVIEHGKAAQTDLTMQLESCALLPLIATTKAGTAKTGLNPRPQAGARVHAVAGIGVPQRFFNSLKELGFELIEHAFPDHHDYQPSDLDFDEHLPIITTSKDAVKIQRFAHLLPEKDIWILPVQAQLSKACYELLLQQLKDLNIGIPNLDKA